MAAAVRGCDPDFIRRDGGRAVDTHHLPILHTLPRSNLRAEGRPVRPPHLLLLLLLAHSPGCILICFSADCCSHRTSMIEEFERQNKDIMRYAWLIWFLSAGAQRLTTDCSSTVPVSCTGSADQSQEVLGLHRPYRTATPSAALASACTLLRMHFDLLFC